MGREIETPERENVRLRAENAQLREELAARNVPWVEGQAVDHLPCHRLGAELFARAEAAETRVREVSAELVEARHTLVGICDARLEDWQQLLDRAEKAEARLRFMETRLTLADDPDLLLCDTHDKAVCDAAGEMPDAALRDWLATDPYARISIFANVARAELARREAHAAEKTAPQQLGLCGACAAGRPQDCSGWCRNHTTGTPDV